MAAIVLALPSLWAQQRLVDQDGFVATVSPVAADDQVKDYLAGQVAAAVENRTGLPLVAQVVESATRAYMNTDQYEADFVDLVSQQHAWLFNPPPAGASTTEMQLDITAMVNRVIAQTGLGAKISGPILVPLNTSGSGLEAGRYHDVGLQITTIALWSTVIGVAASLLALIVARHRGTVLAWLGIGLMLSAAFAWVIGWYFSYRAKQEVDGTDDASRKVTGIIIDSAVDDLHHAAVIVGCAGAVVVLVGVLVRLFARR